jgi:hypothetical protein
MKNLTLTTLFLALTLSISAQTDSCQVLMKQIAGEYTGQCINGLASGKGKSIGEDTYIGFFKDGLPHGKGKYIYKNGDVFRGYWQKGNKDGKGKFEYTLNGEKHTLLGYWENGEYIGVTETNIAYRVTSSSGIMDYKVEKNKLATKLDKEIILSIKSAFTDFAPKDLKIDTSSGQVSHTGKKYKITQYFCPFHCDVSYTIKIAESRKHCRFVIEILEEGKYTITLNND